MGGGGSWGGTLTFRLLLGRDLIGALPHAGALRVRGVSRLFHLGGVLRGRDSLYLAVHGRLGDIRAGFFLFPEPPPCLRNPSYNSSHGSCKAGWNRRCCRTRGHGEGLGLQHVLFLHSK